MTGRCHQYSDVRVTLNTLNEIQSDAVRDGARVSSYLLKLPGYAAHSKAAALKTPASSWQEWDQHASRCRSLDLSRLWPVETLGSVLSVIHFVVKFGKRCSLFLQMISLPLPIFSPAGTPQICPGLLGGDRGALGFVHFLHACFILLFRPGGFTCSVLREDIPCSLVLRSAQSSLLWDLPLSVHFCSCSLQVRSFYLAIPYRFYLFTDISTLSVIFSGFFQLSACGFFLYLFENIYKSLFKVFV